MLFSAKTQKIIRLAIWFFVILPGIPFFLFTLGYIGFLFWPRNFSVIVEQGLGHEIISSEVSHLTLSAHGVKDNPASWSDELQRLMKEKAVGSTQQHISLDWRPYSQSAMSCSVMAKQIGAAFAEKIAQVTQLKSLHLIAHSCGSFLIYGLCTRLKQINPEIKIQTTYLDPVSVYAGFFWDYGVENFGSCADFSDAYIDTGDTVPGSNQALPNSQTLDVTQARLQSNSTEPPHSWPTRFYIQAYQKNDVPLIFQGSDSTHSK